MAFVLEIQGENVFLKNRGKEVGFVELSSLDSNSKALLTSLNKINFKKLQQDMYDFSDNVTAKIKEDDKDIVVFNFVEDNCEVFFDIKDGKLRDIFGREVSINKIRGNFRRVKTEDKNSAILLDYLYNDVLDRPCNPSVKTAMQKVVSYSVNHLSNIKKLFLFGVYLPSYDLERIQMEDVTKDTIKIVKEKMENGEEIRHNMLRTLHFSKQYHETYVKYLKEDNIIYFDILACYKDKYDELVSYFRYDEVTLVEYIKRIVETQNISLSETMKHLYDYANCNHTIGLDKFDKYPRYLRSMHDIATAKLNEYSKDHDVDLKRVYRLDYEEFGIGTGHAKYRNCFYGWIVKVPQNADEIVEEGKIMCHCVAGYVDNVIKGKTKILFLRNTSTYNTEKQHLLTLEVRDGGLVQAKGKYNRSPEGNERDFLKIFCEDKNLKFCI